MAIAKRLNSEKLRKAREDAGLSLADLSAKLFEKGFEASPQNLSNWENGKSEPDTSIGLAIAEVFGKQISYFID